MSSNCKRCFGKIIVAALVFILTFGMSFSWLSGPVLAAGNPQTSKDNFKDEDSFEPNIIQRMIIAPWLIYFDPTRRDVGDQTESIARAAPTSGIYPPSVERIDNLGYTTEPGEPLVGGKMKRTVWRTIKPKSDGRLVLHTFGSSIDTILAVYTGNSLGSLVRVALNDDKPVRGSSTKTSLVSFDVQKDKLYRVQIGSTTGSEGTVLLSSVLLPPEGGLMAQLVTVSVFDAAGGDYVCSVNSSSSGCIEPHFLVYNASGKSVTVTATDNLGGAFTPPAPFSLPAGAAATTSFAPATNFDKTTPRSLSGKFSFSAKQASMAVTGTEIPGTVEVGFTSAPIDVSVVASPAIATPTIGNFGFSWLHIKNNGASNLAGCHFTANTFVASRWRGYSPQTKKTFGTENKIFSIKANSSVDIAIAVARSVPAVAEYRHDGSPISFACTSTPRTNLDFDTTSIGAYKPALIVAALDIGTQIKVPAAGVVIDVSSYNPLPTAQIKVSARYDALFGEEAASKKFKVAICPATMTNAKCLQSSTRQISYTAAGKSAKAFKLAIHAPTAALSPTDKRRVANVIFEQTHPELGLLIVGAASVDVRK